MSKNSIIKGTLILTITGLCTKLLGFYYRIFLTNLIGVKELGIYQLVFPLYILMFAFCCQGFCQALTKHVSAYLGKRMPNCAKRVLFYSIISAVSLSIITASLIHKNAYAIARIILKNTECAPLLQILCIAIPFVVFKALINAYFMGKELPKYQGITQLFEQIIRICSAALLSYCLFTNARNARLAVVAVVIGELAATLLTVIFYIIENKKTTSDTASDISSKPLYNKKQNNTCIYCPSLAKSYMNDAIPMSVNSFIFALFTSFEAVLLPNMLFKFYGDKIFAIELFGIVNGIVLPFLLFPATITTSLSAMLLPTVSCADATKNYKKIKKTLLESVFFCLSLGIIASLIYLLLGEHICNIAFGNNIAGTLLNSMSFLCPFIYISGNLTAILNGIDMAFSNLVYNIIGISIRIACSLMLVPHYGIRAYIYGIAASYITIDSLQFLALSKSIKAKQLTTDMESPDIHNN